MTLVIENLPPSVWRALQERAKISGCSVEAEAKAALKDALHVSENDTLDLLQSLVKQMYGNNLPTHVVDEFLAERYAEAKREEAKL